MNFIDLLSLTNKVLDGYRIAKDEAYTLTEKDQTDIWELMHCANKIRLKFFGTRIKFCSIINAKSGTCSEDCRFCAQSAHYPSISDAYPLVAKEMMIEAGRRAKEAGAHGFSIVTSGKGIYNREERERISEVINDIKDNNFYVCASLGEISIEDARMLKSKGLQRFHHNLETAESFFNNICTTHSYESKIKTIRVAKEAGLEVCSGGIFGMGESWNDRLGMAFALKDLGVDSVPINFLNPVRGTPLENMPLLKPLEALRIIAVYRFIFPDNDITICGGREKILRDLQSYMFYAGANGTMLGNYLTTKGRSAKDDIRMAGDLELVWE